MFISISRFMTKFITLSLKYLILKVKKKIIPITVDDICLKYIKGHNRVDRLLQGLDLFRLNTVDRLLQGLDLFST